MSTIINEADDVPSSTDRPEIILPDKSAASNPDVFDEIAGSYLEAAEILSEHDKGPNCPRLIAPLSLNMCIGVELFLKARLLTKGYTAKQLRDRKRFGHKIHLMWFMDEFTEMRLHAQNFAEALFSADKSAFPDPTRYTIDWTVEYLGKLYGDDTRYALRYPSGKTQVPDIQPL